jgi:tripartite-type tricarboxylate transporter receptor subunit TctC
MKRGLAIVLGVLSLASSSQADETADFYRGKSISLVVSTASGGGYDLWARLLARHFSRHIPGNPNVIVQNTPGSGGLRVMNQLNSVSPRDGTVLAIVHSTAPFTPLLEPQRASFDAQSYGWIGSMTRESSLCIGWATAAAKTFEDLKTHQMIVGSTGAGSHMEIYPRLMNRLFNTRFKVVSGYKGGNDIYIAMERGEAEGRCGITMPALRVVRPEWIAQKKVNFLIQTGLAPGADPISKSVPLLLDMARNEVERQMMELLFVNGELHAPVFTPPGVPPARLAALRAAFKRTLEDPELIADGVKQKMEPTFVSGEEVARLIAKVYATPPSVIKATIAAVEER